jgi:hypothetical protein
MNQTINLPSIRYGLVARISRSHTVLPRTTRSEEAGVQFPVSEVFGLILFWTSVSLLLLC